MGLKYDTFLHRSDTIDHFAEWIWMDIELKYRGIVFRSEESCVNVRNSALYNSTTFITALQCCVMVTKLDFGAMT